MANQEHLDVLEQGANIWNTWRKQHPQTQPDLTEANLSYTNLNQANLSYANLSYTNLSHASLSYANLSYANLNYVDLSYTNLGHANLSKADLTAADLTATDLSSAILRDAYLSGAILSYAYLSGAILSGANLSGADLSYADLSYANLIDANFSYAHLGSADLSGATLRDADLSGVILSSADLRDANLSRAILRDADLSYAHLSGARCRWTAFCNIDLQNVKGLETIRHEGPSSIGTDTLQRSQGNLPEIFLRGAGLSNTFITCAHSLVSQPIQYYTCFISYSSQDEAFSRKLHADLQQQGVHCWFAPEDMKTGDKIRERINQSIHLYDKLLLVLSQHSIASAWVEFEVEAAFAKESSNKQLVLFPVRLDDAITSCQTSWATQLHQIRHITDFSHWEQPDIYQKIFTRLLRDLRAED